MAESVDALVSNTSGAIRAPGTEQRTLTMRVLCSSFIFLEFIGLFIDEFLQFVVGLL